MSDGWMPPYACLASWYHLGGFCHFKHILNTYCVPGTVFGSSPHEGPSPVEQTDDTCINQEEHDMGGHWVV